MSLNCLGFAPIDYLFLLWQFTSTFYWLGFFTAHLWHVGLWFISWLVVCDLPTHIQANYKKKSSLYVYTMEDM